jgi:hypothetical protein
MYISNGMMFYIAFKKMGFCVMYKVVKGGYWGWIDGRESFDNCSIGISSYSTKNSI